jgi:Aldehyde dehydrogenase family
MAIWREEVFGPVLAVRRVTGFDAAVAAVNDSVCGLSVAVFPQDVGLAHRFTELAEAGQGRSTCPPPAGTCITRSAASPTPARRSRSRAWRGCAATPG